MPTMVLAGRRFSGGRFLITYLRDEAGHTAITVPVGQPRKKPDVALGLATICEELVRSSTAIAAAF